MDGVRSDLAVVLSWSWVTWFVAAFGALWGSFMNVAIARVPRGESVVSPGSHCFSCGKPVRGFDNIPVLSWFILRGRCRSCGTQFSIRYALVEALVGALAALLWWKLVLAAPEIEPKERLVRFIIHFAFVGVMVVLAFIDLDTKRLPDVITLPSIPIFFAAGFALHDVAWKERLIGLAAGYLVVRIIADGYYYTTGREGLGLGDGKLLAVVGAFLGWKALPPTIFAASFIGIFVSVPMLLIARAREAKEDAEAAAEETPPEADPKPAVKATAEANAADAEDSDGDDDADTPLRQVEIPFGPFLVISALVYMFYGPEIWAAISRLILGNR